MDNLTHTLIGLAAGEAVARGRRARPDSLPATTLRTTLLVMGMAGGNLPDADLLWSMQSITGDPLSYLVQHRGYTHTLVGCAALAVLLFAATALVLRWRGHRLRAHDAWLLGSMAVLAVMLHLGMDALNEYGVHPFWPWDNRWYYGDWVFIVEPLFWLAVSPLFFHLHGRGARIALGVVLAVGCLAVLVFHRFGAAWWSLPVATLLLLYGGGRVSPRAASLVAIGTLVAVAGSFGVAHALALERVERLASSQFPEARMLDVVLSPAAAHPFCWDVMLLQREGVDYIARIGQMHLAAGNGEACARAIGTGATAPLRNMHRPVVAGMRWTGEYTMEAGSLAALAASTCDTRRLASFLRAPFAAKSPRGWIIGDLRYDREPGAGFAEIEVDRGTAGPCTKSSPWIPPRRDDLGFP